MVVPFVGLTGGMGAGKSESLRALERLGAATLSSDAVVHELLESEEVRGLVAERFGAEVARDRAAIAAAVFADPGQRSWLEGILWPRVGARVAAWKEELQSRSDAPRAAVVEVPLLFESGMETVFDATIAVVAEDSVRAARTSDRDHAATEERDARQLSQDEKADRADFVIRNDGTVAELEEELSRILATMGT